MKCRAAHVEDYFIRGNKATGRLVQHCGDLNKIDDIRMFNELDVILVAEIISTSSMVEVVTVTRAMLTYLLELDEFQEMAEDES